VIRIRAYPLLALFQLHKARVCSGMDPAGQAGQLHVPNDRLRQVIERQDGELEAMRAENAGLCVPVGGRGGADRDADRSSS
jgi:hypothetical protein